VSSVVQISLSKKEDARLKTATIITYASRYIGPPSRCHREKIDDVEGGKIEIVAAARTGELGGEKAIEKAKDTTEKIS